MTPIRDVFHFEWSTSNRELVDFSRNVLELMLRSDSSFIHFPLQSEVSVRKPSVIGVNGHKGLDWGDSATDE